MAGRALDKDGMEALLGYIARQRTLDRPLALDMDYGIYSVAADWTADVLSADPGIPVARDLAALEQALEDPDSAIIFVPRDCGLSRRDIERAASMAGLKKAIFLEDQI
jgi:hypothetical protein